MSGSIFTVWGVRMWASLGGPLFCMPHTESLKRSQLAELTDRMGFRGSFPLAKMIRCPGPYL